MGKPKKKQTAAPKAKTRITVLVVSATRQEPLNGAEVVVTSTTPAGEKSQQGKTAKKKGFRTKKAVKPGDKIISVTLAGYGPPVTQSPSATTPTLPTEGPVTQNLTISASDGEDVTVTIEIAQTRPRGAFFVCDRNYVTQAPFWKAVNGHPIPLIGAKVYILPEASPAPPAPVPAPAGAKETGTTDLDGMFLSSFLKPGTYTITVRKTGFDDYVDTMTMDMSDDVLIHINLKNQWGRVNGNGVRVGKVGFVEWYNKTFRPAQKNKNDLHKIEQAGFDAVFAKFFPGAWKDPLTLEEFVAIVLVMVVETGGKLTPLIEQFNAPELQYFFEPNATTGKASYNSAGNRKAGTLMVARGVLALPKNKSLVNAWNQTSPYPGTSTLVTEAHIRECDFYKYRGHGLIQVTWHDGYNTPEFNEAIQDKGFATLDDCPTATMDDLLKNDSDVYLALMYGWMIARDQNFRAVNNRSWQTLRKAVNAKSAHYDSYSEHCEAMIDAMIAAGPILDPAWVASGSP